MKFSRQRSPFFLFSLLFIAGVAFFSCTNHIGYGVINWSVPEYALVSADVVPVFIQSNIGKVYVIGVGKGQRTRVELPLWQLTLYKSKSGATKAAKLMYEYRYTYAAVKLDGLPIRSLPENTARQVYRLKQGQKIKIIRKGEGAPVFAGNSPLAGDWLEVMADDGSKGWCFSYNLFLFDEREEGGGIEKTGVAGPDTILENLLARAWYPVLYRTMIIDNRIDIDRINPSWGFFPGKEAGIARLDTPEGVVSFPYSSILKAEDGKYQFQGSTLTVQAQNENSIMVQYTDSNGMPQALYYSSLETTAEMLIEVEKERRAEILERIRKEGPRFSSGNYGVLQFLPNGRFLWNGYQLLSPSVIPGGAGEGGTVELRCFLSEPLATAYNGVLSFRFDSSPKWVHFLYNLTAGGSASEGLERSSLKGLKLELVSETNITDSVVLSQNLSPTVIFFTPEKASRGGQ